MTPCPVCNDCGVDSNGDPCLRCENEEFTRYDEEVVA